MVQLMKSEVASALNQQRFLFILLFWFIYIIEVQEQVVFWLDIISVLRTCADVGLCVYFSRNITWLAKDMKLLRLDSLHSTGVLLCILKVIMCCIYSQIWRVLKLPNEVACSFGFSQRHSLSSHRSQPTCIPPWF